MYHQTSICLKEKCIDNPSLSFRKQHGVAVYSACIKFLETKLPLLVPTRKESKKEFHVVWISVCLTTFGTTAGKINGVQSFQPPPTGDGLNEQESIV